MIGLGRLHGMSREKFTWYLCTENAVTTGMSGLEVSVSVWGYNCQNNVTLMCLCLLIIHESDIRVLVQRNSHAFLIRVYNSGLDIVCPKLISSNLNLCSVNSAHGSCREPQFHSYYPLLLFTAAYDSTTGNQTSS